MGKEIPQEIDVEKLMDEDVDEMIPENDVDGDAQQNESESDAVSRQTWCSTQRRLHRDSGAGAAQGQDDCKMHGGCGLLFSREAYVCP